MEEKKLEKGVAEQLRTAVQVKLKADIAEGMTVELPQTARRRLGNICDAPQKDTGEANVGQQQPALVPPSGDVQPPLAAATSGATQMAEVLAEMKSMKEQMARMQGGAHQGTPVRLLPPAPLVSLAGPKVDHDVDGNHTTTARHPEHPNLPQSHDYMGMHTGEKAQRHRNQRLIGVDRVDQAAEFLIHPRATGILFTDHLRGIGHQDSPGRPQHPSAHLDGVLLHHEHSVAPWVDRRTRGVFRPHASLLCIS